MKGPGGGIPVIEWAPGSVRAYDPATGAIHEAATVAEAAQALGRPRSAGLAIGRRHSFLKVVRLPNVSKEDAELALRLQIDQHFPVPSDELAFDFAFQSEVSLEGRTALVAAIRTESLRLARQEFKEAGIKPAWTAPVSLGSASLASSLGLDDALVAESTEDGLGLDEVKGGELVYSRIAGSRLAPIDVSAEAARTLAAAGLGEVPVVASRIDFAGAVLRTNESPLSALSVQTPDISIELPEDRRKTTEGKVTSRRTLAALLGAACLAAGALAWDSRDQANQEVKRVEKEYQQRIKPLESSKGRFNGRLTELKSGAKVVGNAFQPAQTASDVLVVVSNSMPEKLWLTGVTFERGRPLAIRGSALNNDSVAAYVANLAAQSRLRDVKLVFANNSKVEETPVVSFSITAHVIGNLPLVDKTKKPAQRRQTQPRTEARA